MKRLGTFPAALFSCFLISQTVTAETNPQNPPRPDLADHGAGSQASGSALDRQHRIAGGRYVVVRPKDPALLIEPLQQCPATPAPGGSR
jgi:hypothetical protein